MEKIIDIEERIPSMRERRRRRTTKKFLFILIIFLVALLIALYFQSSFSKIDQIIVNGSYLHDQSFYEQESRLKSGESLWSFNKDDIAKHLSTLDGVHKVKISRKWMNHVQIDVTEWEAIGYIEKSGNYTLLLENGEEFLGSTNFSVSEAPILNQFDNKDRLKEMTDQLLDLDENIYHLISEIILTDDDQLTVFMDDGYEVHAIISTFAEKMSYYPEIIAQLDGVEKGIIDMEVGTYFTPYSKVYGEVEADEGVGAENEE